MMPEQVHKIKIYTVSLLLLGLAVFHCCYLQRSDFSVLATLYAVWFLVYAWLATKANPVDTRHWITTGILQRAVFLFAAPNLSNDVYRFIWDGRLSAAGIHPFAHPPNYFIDNQILPEGITTELFSKLNSPEYFTVYPPVCQLVFLIAALLFAQKISGAVFIIKLLLFACEIGTIRLLSRIESSKFIATPAALLYALNPLLITEITGNCHFEGAMIFFMIAGLYALQRQKNDWAAAAWAAAVASKLTPLLLILHLWRWLGWKKGVRFVFVFGAVSLLLFAPLLNLKVLQNMSQSIDLYFRQFQFNASFYYIVREIGYWKLGWDPGEFTGPRLALAGLAGVLLIALFVKKQAPLPSLAAAIMFSLCWQYSCAATVHPWYITVPLAFSLFTRYRFVLLWSALVILTYSHYNGGGLQENYGLIALEYALVWAYFLYEELRN